MAIGSSEGDESYPLELMRAENGWIIGTRQLFEQLVHDLGRNHPLAAISRRFHNGLAEALVKTAIAVREKTGLDRVCLSGGSFNNSYLSQRLGSSLVRAGFQVFVQSAVPCGDGGLSLGQAMVAAAITQHSHLPRE